MAVRVASHSFWNISLTISPLNSVKGGPSLKILTAGLVRRQAVLDQLAARKQIANTLTAGAQAIMRGDMPAFMPSSDQFNLMAELNADMQMW